MSSSVRENIRFILLVLYTLTCLGCGGGSSNTNLANTPAQPNNAAVAMGTVRIQSVLARSVPSTVTHLRATGFSLDGAVTFGPEQVLKASTLDFAMPVTTSRLQLEYLAGNLVVGIGSTNITVLAGQTTELSNLDFQDVSAALSSLTITPGTPSLAKGTTLQLTAVGTFADTAQVDLSSSTIWSTSDSAVATVDTNGVLNAVAPGTTTVQAAVGSVSTQISITVAAATVTSISVSPQPMVLAQGTNGQLTATATFTDGTQQDVTSSVNWSSQSPTLVVATPTGEVQALAAGTATVTATLAGLTGQGTIIVSPASLARIEVTPAGATLATGTAQILTATGVFSDNSTQNLSSSVTWSSLNTGVATVSPTGLLAGVTPGTTTVTASFNGVTGQTGVNVSGAVVSSVVVTPPVPTTNLGLPRQFTATANFSDGTQQNVTNLASWSSSAIGVASVNTSGLAMPVSSGQAIMTAQFQGHSGSGTLTVDSATVTSLTLTPNPSTIASGTSQQFTATAQFSDGSRQDVTSRAAWTTSVPASVSVSPVGLASGLSPGSSTLEARFGGQSETAQVTVSNAVLQSVTVTPGAPAIAAGSTQQMRATANFSDGSSQNVTNSVSWVSGTPAVATINGTGLSSSVSPGQTNLTATLNSVSGTATLTVTPATVTGLSLSPFNPQAVAGFTQRLTATATFSDGTTQDVTSSAVWTSESIAVATVTRPGELLALSPGSSVIRVAFGGQTTNTTFTVSSAIVVNIVITPSNLALAQGATVQMNAVAHLSDGTQQDVTSTGAVWFSTNPSILTVSNTGLVTGVAFGQTRVNADFRLVGNTTLTVTNPSVTSLSLTPSNPTIVEGQTQQFTLSASFSDGTTQDVTSSAAWSSDTPLVASVNGSGLATGLSPGSSQVSATFGGTSTSTNLTVNNPTVSRIDVTPVAPVVPQGTVRQATAIATLSNGSTQEVTNLATWSSSAPTVAAVSTTGLITPVGAGQSFIEASFGGRTAVTRVTATVPDPAIAGITVQPSTALTARGSTRQYRAIANLSDGSTRDITSQVTWSSSNSQVIIPNDNFGLNQVGQARVPESIANGTTVTVTATLGAFSANSTMTVNQYLLACRQFLNTIDSYRVNSDGTLTAVSLGISVPNGPQGAVLSDSGRHVYVTHHDFNQLSVHELGTDGSLTAIETLNTGGVTVAPQISADGRFLYVIERGANSGCRVYSIAADGSLTFVATTTITGFSFADILQVDPQGRLVFMAGSSGIAVLTVNSDGSLTHRETINGFTVTIALDSTGDNLYAGNNITGGSVSAYRIAADGTVTANGITDTANVGADRLIVDGRDRFVYVFHSDTSDVTGYQINFDGSLTALGIVSNNPTGLNSPEVLAAAGHKNAFYHGDGGSGGIITFQIQPNGQVTALPPVGAGSRTAGLVVTP